MTSSTVRYSWLAVSLDKSRERPHSESFQFCSQQGDFLSLTLCCFHQTSSQDNVLHLGLSIGLSWRCPWRGSHTQSRMTQPVERSQCPALHPLHTYICVGTPRGHPMPQHMWLCHTSTTHGHKVMPCLDTQTHTC